MKNKIRVYVAKICLLINLICLFLHTAHSQINTKYFDYFPKECKQALDFYKTNRKLFDEAATRCQSSPEFLFSIVAPEVANYSSLADKFETATVEQFYVELGNQYANFSIGAFQMKPSFVEQLEQLAITYNCFKFIAYYKVNGLKETRKERVQRIKNLQWQMDYLSAFYYFSEKKQPNQFQDVTKKLQFFAIVYNVGLNFNPLDIAKWETFEAFPKGIGNRKFNYSKISIEFYEALVH